MNDLLQPAPPGQHWFVLHARPRCEKKVAVYVGLQGAPAFLPLRRRAHRYGARLRTFTSPLFTGYLFACGDVNLQARLRQNRHVARLLEVPDQATLLGQLGQIRMALELGDLVEVLPYLEVGRRVRVSQGPLRGLEGIVQKVRDRTRMVINLDIIRESVAVEIDSTLLDPA
jgi:hypothetical protein